MRIKIIAVGLLVCFTVAGYAQQESGRRTKDDKKRQKREKINQLLKLEEEGFPSFRKQNAFGIKLNTDGWGLSYELGRSNSVTRATLYQIEFNEKKHPKELKRSDPTASGGGFIFFGNPYVYGKKNIFYQLKLSAGQQLLIGGKGNKNGVSVYGIGTGGLSLGLLRPYYLEMIDNNNNNRNKFVRYESADSLLFMDRASIIGGGGITRGWGQMKVAPGLHAKTAIRFDYNRFNTIVSAIEGGVNAEYYFKNIDQMVYNPTRKFFLNAYVSILFGKRK